MLKVVEAESHDIDDLLNARLLFPEICEYSCISVGAKKKTKKKHLLQFSQKSPDPGCCVTVNEGVEAEKVRAKV